MLDDDLARTVRRSPLSWLARAVDVGLVAMVVVLFDPRLYDPASAPLATLQWTLLWLGLAVVHIVVRVVRVRRARLGDAAWSYRLSGRVLGYLVIASTAVTLLASGLLIAARPGLIELAGVLPDRVAGARLAEIAYVGAIVSLPSVFVAWIVLQLSYAERYARIWLRSDEEDRPIVFPGTPDPTFLEFVYFSFTVGVSVATSDCTIRSDHVRGVVLRHAVLSFLYSTVILGVVIGLVG